MKLIDKDALVQYLTGMAYSACCDENVERIIKKFIIPHINSLEVKEVDLDYIKDELDKIVKIYKPDGDFGWGTLYNIATHFFELGLKAQKGE